MDTLRTTREVFAYAFRSAIDAFRGAYIEHIDYIDDESWAILSNTREGRFLSWSMRKIG